MMADEYIKRSDAIKAVDNLCHVYFPENKAKLEAIPAVDVAPVVYCKNCKYVYETRYFQEIDYTCENENGLNRDVPAYGYCYYGERMDGET